MLGEADNDGTVICHDYLAMEASIGVVLFFLFQRRLAFDAIKFCQAAEDMIESLFFPFDKSILPHCQVYTWNGISWN